MTRGRRLAGAHLPDPRPWRTRLAFRIPALALLVGALPLLATAPAEAQTVWSATLTVDVEGIYAGCAANTQGLDTCTTALSDTNFTFGGQDHVITGMYLQEAEPGFLPTLTLSFPINTQPEQTLNKLTFLVGNPPARFSVNASESASDSNWLFWSNPGLTWTANQKVIVSLVEPHTHGPLPGKPTLTATAQTATTLSFSIPCVTPGAASVTNYELEAEKTDGSVVKHLHTLASPCRTETVTVTDLDNSTAYRVRARARNLYARYSPWSDWVSATTTAQGGGGGGQGQSVGATVSLAVSPNPVDEGDPVMVTATLSSELSSDVTIPLTLTDKTAEADDHGTLESITVLAGFSSASGRITTSHDDDSDNETFTVALDVDNLPSEVTGTIPRPITVTITDDDVVEPQGGSSTLMERCASYLPPNAVSVAEVRGWRDAHSHDAAHVLRWNRVLKALGDDVGAGISSMTVAESKANESRFMRSRWARVTATLEALETCQADSGGQSEAPTVSLSASPSAVAEGSGVTVTATLSSALSSDVTIPLTLADGTAEAEDHGTLASITIKAGSTSGSGTVTTNQDDDTDDETFTVSLGSSLPSSVAAGTPSSVEVTITDDDGGTQGQGGPGPASGPYADLIAKMYEWRNDPRYVHDKAHTDRWDRALLAFGETVSDSSLTPMTAAEAQGYADRGWERWVEVAAAMWEMEGGRPAPDPVVTIAAGGAVTEGEAAGFTLTADPAPAANLAVTVAVSQSGDVADATALGERTVTITAGSTSADFTVATVDDDADEENGQVVAALSAGDGYTVGNAARATVAVADDDEDNPAILTDRAAAREGDDEAVVFNVRLDRAASHTVTVDYATADGAGVWASTGTATAGVDYTATSGTLTFAAGERWKSVSVPILDDVIDEGSEYFLLRFSNPQGATLDDSEVEGLIRNTDLIPGALLARFGRATAEQVVTHIEERMAAPRRRGFRARFAGRELRSGQERDFALGLMSQFSQPMGMGPAGAAPMGMGSHAAGAGAFGANTSGTPGMGAAGGAMGMGGRPGAMGIAGRQTPMGGRAAMGGYGPAGRAHGSGLFDSMGMGGDLFSNSEFELNRESRGGMLSVWSRSSRSYFSGLEDALSLDGDVRTTMFGADYSRGALTVGLSVGRTLGLGGYRRDAATGQMTTSMTGFYPWVGYRVNDRVSVWGVTGYGAGALSLTPEGHAAMETGVSMAMSAVGTRGELVGARATGGFALAFKADALWVGAASDLVDGAMGRLNASDAGVTRVRTALEGSRGYTLVGGRLSLTPSVEVGLRRDGGDAETGAGMDVGGGLAFTDTVTGLSLDVRVRTLVMHQADGFTERGMSLSLGWDPTPSSPLGLTARVAPSWGGSAQGGAEALWNNQMAYGMGSHQMYGAGGQLNADVGYGLPVGARLVGTPRVGLTTSQYGRDYRVGYGLGVLEQGKLNFELGVDAQRREMPMQGEASNGVMGRGTLGW